MGMPGDYGLLAITWVYNLLFMPIERSRDYYNERYSEDNHYDKSYLESPYYNLWLKILPLIPDSDLPILEIGCGTGQFAELMFDWKQQHNHNTPNYTGIDFSQVAINKASEVIAGKLFYADAYYYVIDQYKFIISLETFEHLDDFRIINRIPLGIEVVFTIPDFNDPAHVRYFKNITEVVMRYYHVFDFSHVEKFDKWFICKAVRI